MTVNSFLQKPQRQVSLFSNPTQQLNNNNNRNRYGGNNRKDKQQQRIND